MSFTATGLAPQGTAKGITSADIADLTITNADISNTASINWKKLQTDTQGRILYVNASGEVSGLATGTSGQYLQTQGAGANPIFATIAAAASSGLSQAYYGDSTAAGTQVATFNIPINTLREGSVIFVNWIAKGAGANNIKIEFTINNVSNSFEMGTLGTETHGHLYLMNTPSGSGTNTTLWGRRQTTTGAFTEFGAQNANHTVIRPISASNTVSGALYLDASMSGMISVWY